MRTALAAALLVLALGGAGCIPQWLGPLMERTGATLQRLGKNKLDKGEQGLETSDLLTGLGMVAAGGLLTAGGGLAIRNGRRRNGG